MICTQCYDPAYDSVALNLSPFFLSMTIYEISLLGKVWSVIALTNDELPPDPPREREVYILPYLRDDVTLAVSPTLCSNSWVLLLLLSYFYTSVRHYPKCTLDAYVGDKRLDVEIFNTPPGVAAIKLDKCKRLITNTHTMPDLTEHTLFTVFCPYPVRVICASCADGFREGVLNSLLVVEGAPDASAAIALCDGRIITDSRALCTPSLLLAAASVYADLPVTLTLDGCEYTLYSLGDEIVLSTPAELLSNKKI